MAQAYQAPIPAPDFKLETWAADEEKYIENLRNWLKENGYKGKYVGELVRFPFADGYAVYMVISLRPAKLFHVAIGDAWNIPAAHMRGLTAKDLREQVDSHKRLAEIFKERLEEQQETKLDKI